LRKIQNILPIDAPTLNSLIGQVKKAEYDLVTLLKDNSPKTPKYYIMNVKYDSYLSTKSSFAANGI
jgi:hypothetical protein